MSFIEIISHWHGQTLCLIAKHLSGNLFRSSIGMTIDGWDRMLNRVPGEYGDLSAASWQQSSRSSRYKVGYKVRGVSISIAQTVYVCFVLRNGSTQWGQIYYSAVCENAYALMQCTLLVSLHNIIYGNVAMLTFGISHSLPMFHLGPTPNGRWLQFLLRRVHFYQTIEGQIGTLSEYEVKRNLQTSLTLWDKSKKRTLLRMENISRAL